MVKFFKRLETKKWGVSWSTLLFIVVLFGLAGRLGYSFYLSKFFFGTVRYTFGDSFSYTESFLNLLNHGHYTFEIGNTDAYMYRGPAYPFFWGLHYLLFGPDSVYEAVAFSQSILDTGTGLLIFFILRHLNISNVLSLIGCTLYLLNPIFIVYVPITGTETFANFITTFLIFLAITRSKSIFWLIFIGVTCGFAVLTRQYLGLLLLTVFIFLIALNKTKADLLKHSLLQITIVSLGFASVIGPWYLRNLINHNTNSFLMGKTTGYASFQEDWLAFKDFYSLYFVDVTPIRDRIAFEGTNRLSPADVPHIPFDELERVDRLAHKCGPSFLTWRGEEGYSHTKRSSLPNCKDRVVSGYTKLYEQALDVAPFYFQWQQPLLNVHKSFFKDALVNPLGGRKDFIIGIIFSVRSIVTVGAVLSLIFLRNSPFKMFMLFPIFLIFYISFSAKQVEMRYLTQADAVMIVFFCLLCSSLWSRLKNRYNSKKF